VKFRKKPIVVEAVQWTGDAQSWLFPPNPSKKVKFGGDWAAMPVLASRLRPVSTDDQTTRQQIDELKAAGCSEIFEDVSSGKTTERDGLAEAEHLSPMSASKAT
jgi:hypothetical protein